MSQLVTTEPAKTETTGERSAAHAVALLVAGSFLFLVLMHVKFREFIPR